MLKLKYDKLEQEQLQLKKDFDICKRENNLLLKRFDEISEAVDNRNKKAAIEVREIKQCIEVIGKDIYSYDRQLLYSRPTHKPK